MTTKIKMQCGGCFAEKEVQINRTFNSFNGKGHGFGIVHTPSVDEAVEPTGWVWSDPYTRCTYCPECWKTIENGEAAA